MRTWLLIALATILFPCLAAAQSQPNPPFSFGYVPTAGQWNALFASKQDVLGFTPINQAGASMTGKLTIFASTTGLAGFNMQPGVAPTLPNNGDMWQTSAGLYYQANGVTYGPLVGGGVSVANPGTGALEDLIPTQTVAGASKTFATADLFKKTRRSNSGTAMTDTFPASSATGMVNGTRIIISNVDATASITITAGAGTTILGNATDVVGPGRDVAYTYDLAATQWRGEYNTRTALLAANNLSDVANPSTALSNLGGVSSSTNAFATLTITNGAMSVGGRLTLTTGTPVLTGTVAAAGTVYFTPYLGNLIPLWNGSQFVWTQIAELSNVLANSAVGNAGPSAAAASQVYDLYVWSNAGTPTLTRSPAWSAGTGGSNTARGTGAGGSAQTRVSGILTNTVAITNGPGAGAGTYVGTIATDGSGGTVSWSLGGSASGGTAATLNVWNMFNRVTVAAQSIDSGTSYTYTSATIRQARASAGMQIGLVCGQVDDGISASATYRATTSGAAGATLEFSIGLDSTTAFLNGIFGLFSFPTASAFQAYGTLVAPILASQVLGSHKITLLEAGDGTNANTANANPINSISAALRM